MWFEMKVLPLVWTARINDALFTVLAGSSECGEVQWYRLMKKLARQAVEGSKGV